jgi:hypothetical protein
MMEKTDLQKLQHYAASSRSYVSFGGATYIKLDYKTGKRTAGKAGTDIAGRKFGADVPDVMAGFQWLETGKKPEYALTRILDRDVAPIERAELSNNDPKRWLDPEKDPWQPVSGLPCFDPETHQNFIFLATYSARDAVADLIQAVVDHAAAHPEDADKLPLVEFCVREYPKNDGTTGYALYFEIDSWIDRPKAVLHINPPSLSITSRGDSKAASKSAVKSQSKSSSGDEAKPQRKISVPGGKSDMDDEVPF